MVQQLAPQLWMKLGRSYITVAIHNCLVPWVIFVCSEGEPIPWRGLLPRVSDRKEPMGVRDILLIDPFSDGAF